MDQLPPDEIAGRMDALMDAIPPALEALIRQLDDQVASEFAPRAKAGEGRFIVGIDTGQRFRVQLAWQSYSGGQPIALATFHQDRGPLQ